MPLQYTQLNKNYEYHLIKLSPEDWNGKDVTKRIDNINSDTLIFAGSANLPTADLTRVNSEIYSDLEIVCSGVVFDMEGNSYISIEKKDSEEVEDTVYIDIIVWR